MSGKRKKGRTDDSDTDSLASDHPPDTMDCTLTDPRSNLADGSDLPGLPDDSDLPPAQAQASTSATAAACSSDPGSDPRSSSHAARPSTASDSRSNPDAQQLNPLGSYVVITPVNSDVSFRKVNVFWPEKQIRAICGVPLHHEAPANGTLIIKTEKRAQTKLLLATKVFCEKPVTVSLHPTRNSVKGTIFAPELRHMTEDEIAEGLAGENVTHVRRMTTFRDNQRRDTSLLTLTFNLLWLPEHVYAGRLRYQVRPFIPNPMRCFKCQRYGHGSRNCNKDARCKACGQTPHDGSPCTSPKMCLSCKSTDHVVDSKDCPDWKREKEVCSVHVTEKVSYPEARRIVEQRMPTPAAGSYAQRAQSTADTHSVPPPPPPRAQTTSCATQTDLLPGIPPLQCLPPLTSTSSDVTTTQTQTPDTLQPATTRSESRVNVTSDLHRDRSRSPARQATIRPQPEQTQRIGRPADRSRDPIPTRPAAGQGDQRPRPAVKVALGRARSVSQTRVPPSNDGFWETAQRSARPPRKKY